MKLLLHVEERTVGNELAGEPPESWERIRQEWFESVPLSGAEYVWAQQTQATVSHKLECVFFAGAHPGMRLTAGNDANNPTRTFNVKSVLNEKEQNRKLVWMVEEVFA